MVSLRLRSIILEAVGMKMLEEGKILSKGEYDLCKSVPYRSPLILKHFGNWSRVLNLLQGSYPEIWKELTLKKAVDPLSALAAKKAKRKSEKSEES